MLRRQSLMTMMALLVAVGCSNRPSNDAEPTTSEDSSATESVAVPKTGDSIAPLRDWMRANAGPALKSERLENLNSAFARIETFAPAEPGFERWTTISEAGRTAAQNNDLESVRVACGSCHQSYKQDYKSRLRNRVLNTKG